MYTPEEKQKAVELYIKYDCKGYLVIRELGYPDRKSLRLWYKQYKKGDSFLPSMRKQADHTYSRLFDDEHVLAAVSYYLEHGRSYSATIRALGYPDAINTLRGWVIKIAPEKRRIVNNTTSRNRYPDGDRTGAVAAYYADTEKTVSEIAEEHGITAQVVYYHKQKLEKSGYNLPHMRQKDKKEEIAEASAEIDSLRKQVEELKKESEKLHNENYRLRIENDILETAAELLKKDEGIAIANLRNRDKVQIADALKGKYSLKDLLIIISLPRSSYYYQKDAMSHDKYSEQRKQLRTMFDAGRRCYGYRRLHELFRQSGTRLSEKVVRRLMKEEGLNVYRPRRKKYSSYAGEISPEVPNIINRDFHASQPNEKWLTDITEFGLSNDKVYLSPIIDCFDGLVVSWTIGTSPSAELVNTMLDNAISTLSENEKPLVHSDRGCHYRWPGWIERMSDAGLTRSMSKKGCSPDNSACEAFFGRLKVEMFYGRKWNNISTEDFMEILDGYIRWYNNERIKISLGGLSPMNYRRKLGITA